MSQPQARPARIRVRRAAPALLLALALSGCASMGPSHELVAPATDARPADAPLDPAYKSGSKAESTVARQPSASDAELTGYIRSAAELAMSEGKTYGAIVHLSNLYERDPRDKKIAYDLARHMRFFGARSEAERVVSDALTVHQNDPLLRLELAKIRIEDGRPAEGAAVLKALSAERPGDPSILTPLGVALDHQGEHEAAQAVYAKAMAAERPNAMLLNNAGLSYLMSGDPARAAELLRDASRANGATPQVRQNLALALSLSGQREEARRIAESAAPAEVAKAAMAAFDAIAPTTTAWDIAAER